MAGPSQGNLDAPEPPEGKPAQHPSYWHSFLWRGVALVYAAAALIELIASGKMMVPLRHFPDVTFPQHPLLFLLAAAANLWIVVITWFYAPYDRWNFTLKLPEDSPPAESPPDDSYAGYKRPPRKLGPLRLPPFSVSEVLDPRLGRSLLMVVWSFGLMVSLAGAAQLFHGSFYIGHGAELEIVDYADDPLEFMKVVGWYATVFGGTLILGVLLFLWKPAGLRLPKLNLGKRPGGNLR